MNIQNVLKEILAERRFQVGEILKLKSDIEDTIGKILGKKSEKVKVLKIYLHNETKLGYEYEVETLKDKEVFDVDHSDLE